MGCSIVYFLVISLIFRYSFIRVILIFLLGILNYCVGNVNPNVIISLPQPINNLFSFKFRVVTYNII